MGFRVSRYIIMDITRVNLNVGNVDQKMSLTSYCRWYEAPPTFE